MAYLGTPIDTRNQFQSLSSKQFNGDGSTTAFTLDIAPGSVNDIEVFVGNVRQDPHSAYTLSGTTLTFTGAPPSGTNNIYVVHQAKAVGTINPPDDSVGANQLVDNSVGITQLNVSDGTSGQALTTNGSGTLSFSTISAVAGTNSFRAIGSANQTGVSDNTWTKVDFDTEAFDPDGVFDTSNQRFVAPADGKYFFTAGVNLVGATANGHIVMTRFYKNGSALSYTQKRIQVSVASSDLAEVNQHTTAVLDLSTSDYIEFYAKMDVSSGNVTLQTQTDGIFAGFRVA